MRKALLAAGVLTALAARGLAQTPPPAISVEHAWARATTASATSGVVYLTIVDHGDPDRLTGATTPVAGKAQLHQTTMQDDVMRMRPVDGLALSSREPVTLAPGGYHLMLTGLRQPLQQGRSFPLTLSFEHAGPVQASVIVESAGAAGQMQSGGPGHDMDMPRATDMAKPPARQ